MKNSLPILSLSLLIGSTGFAKTLFVCENLTQARETTVVIKETAPSSYKMIIYRTISGHATTPETVTVYPLSGTRGSVVAYGDQKQNKVLMMNLSDRNQKGEVTGTYRDSIQKDVLEVSCK